MSSVEAYHHSADSRPRIPTQEEAGSEAENPVVTNRKKLEIPFRNPINHRGQDPELFWKDKYGSDDQQEGLETDSRSLYRYEHISPETLMSRLYRAETTHPAQLGLFTTFGNDIEIDELEKVSEYYRHQDGWTNRLIQGDSKLVMASLLTRENMTGKVQTIYFDPPYGIKYNSNWQQKLNNRDVVDGKDENITSEPEQIKAFRDTWIDGIHSYLTYMRDRLMVARELLTESGSCFVQISDENVHLVRCLMDEVFGSDNFVSLITFQKTTGSTTVALPRTSDYLIWYAKNINDLKVRKLFQRQVFGEDGAKEYKRVELSNEELLPISNFISNGKVVLPEGARIFATDSIVSAGGNDPDIELDWEGRKTILSCKPERHWKAGVAGTERLWEIGRLLRQKGLRIYKRYFEDFPYRELTHVWADTRGEDNAEYVVQTSTKVVERCLLMTTDPGDLVLDPTCGSGTTAYVAEQWGRRWITIDTSRIAINIAKTRLMTATFPYYHLYSEVNVSVDKKEGKIKKTLTPKPVSEVVTDIRQGFIYEEVPHITLKSLANDEPPESETLYDRPIEDKKRLRVSGPFTVETLQSYETVSPDDLDAPAATTPDDDEAFEHRVCEYLKSVGVINGDKQERAIFTRVERLGHAHLHAEGYYNTGTGEQKAYIHIGPRFGAVSKVALSHAVKDCRLEGDASWLLVMGFAFESNVEGKNVGGFRVDKIRMADDLLQEGLTKKDKKAGSFIIIGEPDIVAVPDGNNVVIEVRGMDIYDPIKDEVKPRNVADIAYWMVDDDYNSSNFIARQVFFCGGDKDEFDKWRKGLSNMSQQATKRKTEATLRIELDDDAFDRLYGFRSHPITKEKGKKVAVRVVSQFGEESTKVLTLGK